MPATYGQGGIGAIYDLLRKRSYRKWRSEQERIYELSNIIFESNDHDEISEALAELEDLQYDVRMHSIYVDGVRDALSFVKERLSE